MAPSVQGLYFKDLKQILRKEQCDGSILITANVPSAKKIVVHGPLEPEAGGIPSQFPVQEDTQFLQILQESLDFFSIDESKQREYFLVDYRTSNDPFTLDSPSAILDLCTLAFNPCYLQTRSTIHRRMCATTTSSNDPSTHS